MKFKVVNPEIVYDNFITVEKAEIQSSDRSVNFDRTRVVRDDASVMLIHNTESNTVITVEQFRYPVHEKIDENLLEIPAGKLDRGESPENAAIREAMEECGYRLPPENIKSLGAFFASPGYTSEQFHLFYIPVNNAHKQGKGGGIKHENEYINVTELPVDEFYKRIDNGRIRDAKTALAALISRRFLQNE